MPEHGSDDLPILLVSTKVDVATDAVVRSLAARGISFIRANTEDFPYHVGWSFRITTNSCPELRVPSTECRYRSVWWRRVRSPERPANMLQGVHEYCVREGQDFVVGAVQSIAARIMSDPARVWAAEHKLWQLTIARECGLEISDTVATNVPEEIRRAFSDFGGELICKPVRTGFVDLGTEQRAIYTVRLLAEHLEQLGDAKWSPAIYQRWVRKSLDIRITVVGTRIFVASIDSLSDPAAIVDWRRTTNPDLPHAVIDLPESLEHAILALMARLGLSFGALDFVLTPDGRFVFLEINPNGQWMWLDDKLGFGITDAVVDWLCAHTDP